jgi:hypothetical protein
MAAMAFAESLGLPLWSAGGKLVEFDITIVFSIDKNSMFCFDFVSARLSELALVECPMLTLQRVYSIFRNSHKPPVASTLPTLHGLLSAEALPIQLPS